MKKKNLIIITIAVIAAAVGAFSLFLTPDNEQAASDEPQVKSATNENGDIVIPVEDITEEPAFYSYDELDSKMEVIAVKASDGSIRTAFNTCQVCYSSGRGYYIQEGDELVCQNCGNRFTMDQVETVAGGCNPVPILREYKEVTDESITITKEFLQEAEIIFKNWKI